MTSTLRALPLLAAVALLAACGPSPDDAAAEDATSAGGTVAEPSTSAGDEWTPVDRSADFAEWSDVVTSASETEPGRIAVATNLLADVDDAAVPMAICRAASELDGVTYVSVAEADGTAWVLFGHPAYPEGVCSTV